MGTSLLYLRLVAMHDAFGNVFFLYIKVIRRWILAQGGVERLTWPLTVNQVSELDLDMLWVMFHYRFVGNPLAGAVIRCAPIRARRESR